MSNSAENSLTIENGNQPDASLGSPSETETISAPEIPSIQDAPLTDDNERNFFDYDYISNLGKDSEDPADEKSAEKSADLSDLPGFTFDKPKTEDIPEEKPEETVDQPAPEDNPADDTKTGEEAKPAEVPENSESEKSEAEKAIDEDPSLSDDEKTAIKELPKKKWEDYRKAKNYARTEAKFLDPNEKITDFVGHLEQKSPARLNELRSEILLESVTNTDEAGAKTVDGGKLLKTLFETTGAETYTQVVSSIVENYPAQAAEILKTKGFTLVADGDAGAPSSTDLPEIDNERINTILTDLESYYDDEDLELLRSALKGRTASPKTENDAAAVPVAAEVPEGADNADIPAVSAAGEPDNEPAPETLETGEGTEKTEFQTPSPKEQEAQNWNNAVNESIPIIDNHLNSLMDDQFALGISETERTTIPELAAVKEDKRHLLLHGSNDGSLPAFDVGLVSRFKDDGDFKKAFDSFAYFANKGELDNAKNAISKLKPFAETYLEERMDHAAVKSKDSLIKIISDSYNQKSHSPAESIFLEGSTGLGGNQSKTENTNSFLDPSNL